jgi:hypothetical protein
MTREQFIGMLKSPAVIDLNKVRDLEDITAQFPYFQNAHLLLARQYYGHENIRYDSHLKKASAYAPDRRVLYNLIHLPATDVVHMQVVKEETVAATVSEPVAETVFPHEIPSQETSDVAAVHSADVSEAKETVTTTEVTVSAGHETEENDTDPRAIIEQRLREIERQYLRAGAAPSDEVPTEVIVPAPEKVTETPTAAETPAPAASALPPVIQTPVKSDSTKMSFADWLKVKSVPVAPASDPKNYFGEKVTRTPEPPKEVPASPPPAPAKRPSSLHTDKIIEKFIQEEPRIEPSKSEFYSPGNMARKSLIEHDDLISETLAGIYARQGNKQRATDMYLKLSLKFPEKSAYFAALIKNLETEE